MACMGRLQLPAGLNDLIELYNVRMVDELQDVNLPKVGPKYGYILITSYHPTAIHYRINSPSPQT
eukprot:3696482-Amphidinium_carterae.1